MLTKKMKQLHDKIFPSKISEDKKSSLIIQNWLEENYDKNLTGIEKVKCSKRGIVINLTEEIDFNVLKEAIDNHELEDPRYDKVYLEAKEEDHLKIYEVQETELSRAKFKSGITFKKESKDILLGRNIVFSDSKVNDNISPEQKIKSGVTKQTLRNLELYLSEKYNR